MDTAALSLSPLGTPEFQLYLIVHIEVKTRFPRGVLRGRAPHHSLLWVVPEGHAQSLQLILIINFFDFEFISGECVQTVK